MRPATQKESLPNNVESLICRLGQELSCSICLSVFENPTMTPCNHTFCRDCIERAVSLTKKSSSVPINQCPICKSKVPKRSLNPSAAAAKLCSIYEEIVRSFSELNGGNEDWMHEAGIRGNDSYYTGGGVALDNLTQLYPYAEKPKPSKSSSSKSKTTAKNQNISISETEDDNVTQLNLSQEHESNEISRVYDETTQLDNLNVVPDIFPSSPLLYNEPDQETQFTGNDRLIINTQELEKLAAINDSIDRELAELETKLAENINVDNIETDMMKKWKEKDNFNLLEKGKLLEKEKENTIQNLEISNSNSKTDTDNSISSNNILINTTKLTNHKVKVYSKKIKIIKSKNENVKCVTKKQKTDEKELLQIDIDSIAEQNQIISLKAITTTAIKDENSLLLLTKWSDLFNIQILPNLNSTEVTHLIIPTGPDLIVKKRTIKYFEALLLGASKIQIVSFEWIEACLKKQSSKEKEKLIDPRPFRIKGDEIGLSRSIKTKTSGDISKIFSSVKFYFYGHFSQPPRDQLEKLIKSSNCLIIKTTKELSRGTIVLADPGSQFTFEQDAETIRKYPIVSPTWLMDSISCGMLLDFYGYLVL